VPETPTAGSTLHQRYVFFKDLDHTVEAARGYALMPIVILTGELHVSFAILHAEDGRFLLHDQCECPLLGLRSSCCSHSDRVGSCRSSWVLVLFAASSAAPAAGWYRNRDEEQHHC